LRRHREGYWNLSTDEKHGLLYDRIITPTMAATAERNSKMGRKTSPENEPGYFVFDK
jgi:hypothetical protein